MGKREGVEFMCDRCGRKIFIEHHGGVLNADLPGGWGELFNSAHRDVLCRGCYDKYTKLLNRFMEPEGEE